MATPGEDNMTEPTPALTPTAEIPADLSPPATTDVDNDSDPPRMETTGEVEEPDPTPDVPPTAHTERAAPTLLPPPTMGRMLGYALLCGFVGFLVSLHSFAAATLPHILTPDGYNFQGVQEGLPIPRLLDWNPTLIGLLQQYTTLHPVLLALGAVLVFGSLWICTLSVLFPSLRIFRPHHTVVSELDSLSTPPGHSAVALDGRLLLRLTWLLILVATPLAVLSGLAAFAATRFAMQEITIQAVLFLIAGIWIRFALRPSGFVGRSLFPATSPSRHHRRYASVKELSVGVPFGLFLCVLQRSAMHLPAPDVLRSLHALGIFHIGRWYALGFHYLLSIGLICFGAGLLLLLFVPLPTRLQPKVWPLLLAVLCVSSAIWLQTPYSSQSLADNWNITPPIMLTVWPYSPRSAASGVPDGREAGKALASLAKITADSTPTSPDRRFLLFTQAGAFDGLQHGYTEDALTADLASIPKVKAFLQSHDYTTALSWTAFKHIFNVCNVHFDSTQALRASLDDLERTPHAAVMPAVRDMLFTVAASPENLAILNEWADPTRFDPADRASLKLLGDLYLRFGEQKTALEWYARADMPHSFMAQVRSHKPLFHAGQIQGTLVWNGKPLAGVQVGAFPFLQNGLPKDLEGEVRDAERQLMPEFPATRGFGPMEPRPYQFRWMSAGTTTDSAGHFTLNHLTEGTYHLVCTLPPDVALRPFQDDRLHILHAPGDITVRYRTLHTNLEKADLGKIELTFTP